jgi:hypothetical protein
MDLEALNDQKVYGASEYHKVQGYVDFHVAAGIILNNVSFNCRAVRYACPVRILGLTLISASIK